MADGVNFGAMVLAFYLGGFAGVGGMLISSDAAASKSKILAVSAALLWPLFLVVIFASRDQIKLKSSE